MEGIVNKKYLRVPDFLFQKAPANYITAIGRNALGLNKKKLTIDDIRNLKAKKQKKKTEIQAVKNKKQQVVTEEDVFSVINKKRTLPVEEVDERKDKLVKKTTLFDNIDWLNIPEAKKMTATVDKDRKNEQTETINKFNTLDKVVKKGASSDLMGFMDNTTDWKQDIERLLASKNESSDIVKILNRSLRYALKEHALEDLKFHLNCILANTDKMQNDSIALETVLSHVNSMLRYTRDNEVLILSHEALQKMKLNRNEMVKFLKSCIPKSAENYTESGWCLRELYLLEAAEFDDDLIAKKTMLSDYMFKYGDDIIEVLYESAILEMGNIENVNELLQKKPLVQWEEYLDSKIYNDENKDLDDFIKYFVSIVIQNRYNEGNLNNFKNILNKFEMDRLKTYVCEQILKQDLSTNIWEYFFNQSLAKNIEITETVSLIENLLIEATHSAENTVCLIEIFVEKYCYHGNGKYHKVVRDFVNKHLSLNSHMIYHQLKLQRLTEGANSDDILKFDNLKNGEGELTKPEYLLEYINWNIALNTTTTSIENLYLLGIQKFENDLDISVLKCHYYKHLIKTNKQSKCCKLVVADLNNSPLVVEYVDVLILCMNKDNSEVIFNEWTQFYQSLLSKYPSDRVTILMILEKLLYRKVFIEQENSKNIRLINEFLTDKQVDSELIKLNPNLGLIISLLLATELAHLRKTQNRNYKMLLKTTLKKYLTDYDNNYLLLYTIAYELKDCKWLMNSINKNPKFEVPYEDMLSNTDRCMNFLNYAESKDTLVRNNMRSIYTPELRFIEFNAIYRI